jgi:hypothetical protein
MKRRQIRPQRDLDLAILQFDDQRVLRIGGLRHCWKGARDRGGQRQLRRQE